MILGLSGLFDQLRTKNNQRTLSKRELQTSLTGAGQKKKSWGIVLKNYDIRVNKLFAKLSKICHNKPR